MDVRTITPDELDALRRRGVPVDLIDVRTPAEFRQLHADLARSVPLDGLDPGRFMAARGGVGERALHVICQSGARSRRAVERFHAAGFADVVDVEGGTLAWKRAGLPVVEGGRTMSLERQVRIAAGSLVAVGTLLGLAVHPGFLGLSGFVGAGLIFSGVTDTCGMGMILARMPWNRLGEAAPPR